MTRVLVVEDEPGLRKALGINLRARGYEVTLAATAAPRSPRPRSIRPTPSSSTSACPTWTGPR